MEDDGATSFEKDTVIPIPENAASLLGLFAPPPTPPTPAHRNRGVSPVESYSPKRHEFPQAPSQQHITKSARLPLFPETDAGMEHPPASPRSHITPRTEQTPLLAPFENGSLTHIQSLFSPSINERMSSQQQPSTSSAVHSDTSATAQQQSKNLQSVFEKESSSPNNSNTDRKSLLVDSTLHPSGEASRTVNNDPSKQKQPTTNILSSLKHLSKTSFAAVSKPSTWVGALLFCFFQVVFCLTMGATITRRHGTTSMLGLMSKMAAVGVIFGAPVLWITLPDVPAMYPTVDLFAAPFLANIALLVDEALFLDPTVAPEENDQYFLGSYTILVSISLFLSGFLLLLTSVFKLADLGSFLPFPVLCGFFAAASVMTWMLAFKVDTNGLSVSEVLLSGEPQVILKALAHHIPSVIVAVTMKILGPKNPFFVIMLVMATIGLFYAVVFTFGFSLDEMREWEWLYTKDELYYKPMYQPIGFSIWATPAPFGWINALCQGKVHWGAVAHGLETSCALSLLYLIRCSLHGAALKKNVPMLTRVEQIESSLEKDLSMQSSFRRTVRASNNNTPLTPTRKTTLSRVPPRRSHQRNFSEVLDIENHIDLLDENKTTHIVAAKPMISTLRDVLLHYGWGQFVCGFVGSCPILPCVAASSTMYTLGAEGLAPQIGSVMLLFIFYLTSFQIVSFVPKPAFSSLLVLSFIDMMSSWVIKSYFKTKEKAEWLVVPTIVVLSFVFSLLQAVFIGLALSTLLFVASFFRSGVVKYVANGLTIRSTIERSPKASTWLSDKADHIQIIVLQNYLFFGNATSIPSFIATMFEEPPNGADVTFLPPIPKIVILDLTLVTGLDTSAVDAFSDIVMICKRHDCRVFLSGVSTTIREIMRLSGLKPEITRDRSHRMLRFFLDLDSAIGKAEDLLMDLFSFTEDEPARCGSLDGFFQTLCLIDTQHHVNYANELRGLSEFSMMMDLSPGEILYKDRSLERGLFFIEKGIMKIERDSSATISRNGTLIGISSVESTLTKMKARTGPIGRGIAKLKIEGIDAQESRRFRVARVGPGWVLGSLEALDRSISPRNMIAVTRCRVHYIAYRKLEELEKINPAIVLNLYKLLAHLMAKRQEITISQLGTLHAIMSSPAKKKPMTRCDSASSMRLWFGSKDD